MFKSFIAYNNTELEKKKIVSNAESLYKSKLIGVEQWNEICEAYSTNLYTPNLFMRVLFFILSYIGFATVSMPFGLAFSSLGSEGFQVLFIVLGIALLVLTEKFLIQKNHHYLSGISEAGLFTGISFLSMGILMNGPENRFIYPIFLGIIFGLAAFRYLNRVALVIAVGLWAWFIFEILTSIGGYAEAFIPFVLMLYFATLYFRTLQVEKKETSIIFDDFYLILKSISLTCFYVAGNYFVVRELSVNLMGLELAEGEDIPFAFLFYAFTFIIPLGYMYWGVKKKSILFIRIGLMLTVLSVITFKYYFSLGAPVVTITIAGALLIAIALLLFNYLKKSRNGFTRENIILNSSHSKDLTAFIASQTLGGDVTETSNTNSFGGGQFGGGGANSDW